MSEAHLLIMTLHVMLAKLLNWLNWFLDGTTAILRQHQQLLYLILSSSQRTLDVSLGFQADV